MREVASTTTSLDPARKAYDAGSPEVIAFLSDLSAAGDVSLIPTGQCAKSVSFGTVTTVSVGDRTSGDLECLENPTTTDTALAHDCGVLTGTIL
jgi:hypothetical protein